MQFEWHKRRDEWKEKCHSLSTAALQTLAKQTKLTSSNHASE